MTDKIAATTWAVLLFGASIGCSSGHSIAKPRSGTLSPGTAEIVVNDRDLGTTDLVQCAQSGSLTTISTGYKVGGATVSLSNAHQLAVEFVGIRDLDGFDGSYARDLQGLAAVALNGSTYSITGAAVGFNGAEPSGRTDATFTIKAAC